jgi:hypothetical protein
VIIRSDSPIAEPFQAWVVSEVLPSIRKTGAYVSPTIGTPVVVLAGTEAVSRWSDWWSDWQANGGHCWPVRASHSRGKLARPEGFEPPTT